MVVPSALELVSSLILAATPVQCSIPVAPIINIKPVTADIQYDFSKTDQQLTAMKSNTISPYGINADMVTRGLRHDKPTMDYNIQFGSAVHPSSGTFCVWYKQIDINIKLSPKIYIAKGYNKGKCGQFILNHEKKHVLVDRQVMNKYAQMMGKSVQNAVNMAGALGPYNMDKVDSVRDGMSKHIDSALQSVLLLMQNEMNNKQQAIDSKEEYDAGHEACKELNKQIMMNSLNAKR